MHHPSLHRNDDLSHLFPKPGLGERMDAACRQRQIDRPTCADSDAPHIRTSFVDLNPETAFNKAKCQEWSVEPGANQRHGLGFTSHGQVRTNSDRARTATPTTAFAPPTIRGRTFCPAYVSNTTTRHFRRFPCERQSPVPQVECAAASNSPPVRQTL